MRTIKQIHTAVSAPIGDLITFRALPSRSVNHIDPFLFLNHHGPQVYGPNNNGLPFGPHPHRGFETVTFIMKGDIMHWDSRGSKSVIKEGGIQWMTAGSGLIHSEISSPEFKRDGGEEEVLQLWINLPSKHKTTKPNYTGLSEDQIPEISEDEGKVLIKLISGTWKKTTGPIVPLNEIMLSSIKLKDKGTFEIDVPLSHNIFFYVVKGTVTVNGKIAQMHNLVEFNNDGLKVKVETQSESILLFGNAVPFNEPIVAQGPFVMNSMEEVKQAYNDYQAGKMGKLDEFS